MAKKRHGQEPEPGGKGQELDLPPDQREDRPPTEMKSVQIAFVSHQRREGVQCTWSPGVATHASLLLPMTASLADTCCARLPRQALPWLAPLRACTELRVLLRGDEAWLYWPAGDSELARTLLALDGAELFARRDGQWFAPGRHLPCFDVPPPDEARALGGVLAPIPVEPVGPAPCRCAPVALRLVPCERHRPCTLLRVSLADLGRWADHATSGQLAALLAARDLDRVLLRGPALPALPGERFWGQRVLLPAGWRAEPELPEAVLATVLRLEPDDLGLLTQQGAEVIPLTAFAPLTRAGVRRAVSEVSA
jgi:hypothetical protein